MLHALLALALPVLSPAPAQDDPPPPPPPASSIAEATLPEGAEVFARVAVIGASASAGFEVDEEVGAHTSLADALEQMLPAGRAPVLDAASSFLFLDPLGNGTDHVELALEADPTLVVAVDFLFWFTYGRMADDARPAFLEEGLALLDRLACPIVIGDIPDMSDAVGKMLTRDMVPSPASLEALNARIAAWADARDRVTRVELAHMLARMRASERIELRGQVWDEGASRDLLQWDQLHPTLDGLVALAILCVDAVASADEELPADAVDWRAEELAQSVYDSKEEERRAREERERRREERRKKKEAEQAGSDPFAQNRTIVSCLLVGTSGNDSTSMS